MDARGKRERGRERKLCQPPLKPTKTVCVCALTYAHMWIMMPVCLCAIACSCMHSTNLHGFLYVCVCAKPHVCVGAVRTSRIPCGHMGPYAPEYSLTARMCVRFGQGERCEVVDGGRRGGEISLPVTDSSMQSMSPQGRDQEAGPLTQAEGEGGRGEQCKMWPFEEGIRGGGLCLQARLDK